METDRGNTGTMTFGSGSKKRVRESDASLSKKDEGVPKEYMTFWTFASDFDGKSKTINSEAEKEEQEQDDTGDVQDALENPAIQEDTNDAELLVQYPAGRLLQSQHKTKQPENDFEIVHSTSSVVGRENSSTGNLNVSTSIVEASEKRQTKRKDRPKSFDRFWNSTSLIFRLDPEEISNSLSDSASSMNVEEMKSKRKEKKQLDLTEREEDVNLFTENLDDLCTIDITDLFADTVVSDDEFVKKVHKNLPSIATTRASVLQSAKLAAVYATNMSRQAAFNKEFAARRVRHETAWFGLNFEEGAETRHYYEKWKKIQAERVYQKISTKLFCPISAQRKKYAEVFSTVNISGANIAPLLPYEYNGRSMMSLDERGFVTECYRMYYHKRSTGSEEPLTVEIIGYFEDLTKDFMDLEQKDREAEAKKKLDALAPPSVPSLSLTSRSDTQQNTLLPTVTLKERNEFLKRQEKTAPFSIRDGAAAFAGVAKKKTQRKRKEKVSTDSTKPKRDKLPTEKGKKKKKIPTEGDYSAENYDQYLFDLAESNRLAKYADFCNFESQRGYVKIPSGMPAIELFDHTNSKQNFAINKEKSKQFQMYSLVGVDQHGITWVAPPIRKEYSEFNAYKAQEIVQAACIITDGLAQPAPREIQNIVSLDVSESLNQQYKSGNPIFELHEETDRMDKEFGIFHTHVCWWKYRFDQLNRERLSQQQDDDDNSDVKQNTPSFDRFIQNHSNYDFATIAEHFKVGIKPDEKAISNESTQLSEENELIRAVDWYHGMRSDNATTRVGEMKFPETVERISRLQSETELITKHAQLSGDTKAIEIFKQRREQYDSVMYRMHEKNSEDGRQRRRHINASEVKFLEPVCYFERSEEKETGLCLLGEFAWNSYCCLCCEQVRFSTDKSVAENRESKNKDDCGPAVGYEFANEFQRGVARCSSCRKCFHWICLDPSIVDFTWQHQFDYTRAYTCFECVYEAATQKEREQSLLARKIEEYRQELFLCQVKRGHAFRRSLSLLQNVQDMHVGDELLLCEGVPIPVHEDDAEEWQTRFLCGCYLYLEMNIAFYFKENINLLIDCPRRNCFSVTMRSKVTGNRAKLLPCYRKMMENYLKLHRFEEKEVSRSVPESVTVVPIVDVTRRLYKKLWHHEVPVRRI